MTHAWRTLVPVVAVVVVLLAAARVQSTPAPEPVAPRPAAAILPWTVNQGPNQSSTVLLTYDDCPDSAESFRAVVDEAEEMGVSIALLPYERCTRVDADYARAHGQIVAGHSVSHARLTELDAAGVRAEIDTHSRASGVIRPPYGAHDDAVDAVLAANGVRVWLWTVDTRDWTGRTRDEVVSHVIANAVGGDTVLMHMGRAAFDPTALREMVGGLAARGVQVCGISAGREAAANGGRIPDALTC